MTKAQRQQFQETFLKEILEDAFSAAVDMGYEAGKGRDNERHVRSFEIASEKVYKALGLKGNI